MWLSAPGPWCEPWCRELRAVDERDPNVLEHLDDGVHVDGARAVLTRWSKVSMVSMVGTR